MTARHHLFQVFLIVFLFATGCKKDHGTKAGSAEAEMTSFKIAGKDAVVDIQPTLEAVKVRLQDDVLDASNLVAEFAASAGSDISVNGVRQQSGSTSNNFESIVPYKVSSENGVASKTWMVSATNNDITTKYGMGQILKSAKSNDRDYGWYMDQGTTGTYAYVNCGPTSVTMAIKWADAGFTGIPQDARAAHFNGGGWWYNSDITSYLGANSISNATIGLGINAEDTWNRLKRQLDFGRVLILIVDMHQISSEDPANSSARVGKFYHTTQGWGHIFVVKGYRNVDQQHFLQVYDPYSIGATYTLDDNSPKGKDRYYSFTDVYNASVNWWNYAIIVVPKGTVIDHSTLRSALPEASIPRSPEPMQGH